MENLFTSKYTVDNVDLHKISNRHSQILFCKGMKIRIDKYQ